MGIVSSVQKVSYDKQIKGLVKKKLAQTSEKIAKEGILDEDDYGRVVPPENYWKPIPNHEDGSFYGIDGWVENFTNLMDRHPVYVDSDDAFAGRWMFFMSKMRANKWNPNYPYDHLKSNIEKYDIITGIGDDAHFAPDYEIGLKLGWKGLLEKVAHYREINTSPEQTHFYNCHEKVIRSVQGWIQRHIAKIEELILTDQEVKNKDNLIQMAETNRNILENPPRSLREACQWIIWYHLASRTFNRDGAGGQIDELLRPFYEKDIAENRITKTDAIYYLSCFLINDPIYWQLGGPDENGEDMTSEISFLILEAADKINTSLNITIRVHDKLDKKLFKQSIHYLIKNKNAWPRYSGDKALLKGFMRNGFDLNTARKRIAVGCNWMSLPGQEYTMNDLVKVNMAKVFEVTYHELMESKSTNHTTEQLWKLFKRHLREAIGTAADCIRHHLNYQRFNEVELMLNLLSHGPLEKGLDVSAGGAKYYNLAIDGAGLAVVADSFAALQERIEIEGRKTWNEIYKYVKSNYSGMDGERIRLLMKNSSRFGHGNTIADNWAKRISTSFTGYVREQSEPELQHLFIPGLFSWANTVGFGKAVGATPNGRLAQTPISHGANPNPGFSADGASLALARAIANVQPGYGNTAPMQWELDPSIATKDHQGLIGAIIKTHFELGGTLINVNIMDKDKILKAHKDPELYPDIVVRITGFTAYFSMLSPEFRQLVVDRLLEN